jgi:hypothetical protein
MPYIILGRYSSTFVNGFYRLFNGFYDRACTQMQPVRALSIALVLCCSILNALKLLTAQLAQSLRAYEQRTEHCCVLLLHVRPSRC